MRVIAENENFRIVQDDFAVTLDDYAKRKLGSNFSVGKAFDKNLNRYVSYLLYKDSKAIVEDTSFEGMCFEIDMLRIVVESQDW